MQTHPRPTVPAQVRIALSRRGSLRFAHIHVTSGDVPRELLEALVREIASDGIICIPGAGWVCGRPSNDNNKVEEGGA